MKGKRILFTTYHDESYEEGLSYAMELAKTMADDIEILLVYKRKVMEKFDDLMTAVTFAESDEHKTARELITADLMSHGQDLDEKLRLIKDKCEKAGLQTEVNISASGVVSAIKNILKTNPRIDMVLLSPSITADGHVTSRELNKLVKTSSRPVVTMSKQARSA